VIARFKTCYSSLPVRGDYKKRLFLETYGAVMSFKEPGETLGWQKEKNFTSLALHVLALLLGVV
jgi:hypothetical protein